MSEVQRVLSGCKNCFEILRLPVDQNVKPSSVREAYRAASLLVHPDKNKDPRSNQAFQAVQAAKELLLNDEERKKHCEKIKKSVAEDAAKQAHRNWMQEAFNCDAEKYYQEKERQRKAKKEADRLAQKRQWGEINRLRNEEEARQQKLRKSADNRQKTFLDPVQKQPPAPSIRSEPAISTTALHSKITQLSREVCGAEQHSSTDDSPHKSKKDKKKKKEKKKSSKDKKSKKEKKDKLQQLRMERYLREAKESIREKRIL
eukprot:TRINITY_DN33793_c0_g1_i1.p1 TRINITY_DN33793_c0_g1~~TRINITY_DN33793_c0_g1_i1.p1  ORF type:complete len:259 (+),score=82.49 TRINITY_DN33793_c0_g1_i1:128-904(+)